MRKRLILTLTVILLATGLIFSSYKPQAYIDYWSGLENPWGVFYSDGVYEYDYGLNFILDNDYYSWRLSTGNPAALITTSNRRDRSTGLHNSDRRGWEYVSTEWLTYPRLELFHQYGTDSEGYNEYINDSYYPKTSSSVTDHIDDGGSAIYYDGNGWYRYRRAVLMIYRRPISRPVHYASYIESLVGNSYSNGNTLWVQPNKDILLKSAGYDARPDAEGSNSQYSENVRDNYFLIHSTDNSIFMDYVVNASNNSVNWYNGQALGASYTHDIKVSSLKFMPNSIWVNSIGRNLTESQTYLKLPDSKDFILEFDHRNKYNFWMAYGRYTKFTYGSTAYDYLKTDGTPPTASFTYVSNKTNSSFQVTTTNIVDTRSGFNKAELVAWTKSDKSDSKTYPMTTVDGINWTATVNKSDFSGIITGYKCEVVAYDNLLNSGVVGSQSNIDLAMANLKITSQIVDDFDSVVTNLKQGKPYRVKSTITNIGDWNATTSFHYLKDSVGLPIGNFLTGNIAAGATKVLYLPFTPLIVGNYNYSTSVNEDRVFEEPDYTNNYYSGSATVLSSTPSNGSFFVYSFDYKESDTIYWVRQQNSTTNIGFSTSANFPVAYGDYPTSLEVAFSKDGSPPINNVTSVQYATIFNHFSKGSEYNSNFSFINDGAKAITKRNLSNDYILSATQKIAGILDKSSYKLYYRASNNVDGVDYYSNYVDTGVWFKVDGTAPTGNFGVDTDMYGNAEISILNCSDVGSGLNKAYVDVYDVANPSSKTRLNLNKSGNNFTLTVNPYTYVSGASMGIDGYIVDNVGNIRNMGNRILELLTVNATIAPYNQPDFSGVPTLMQGQRGILTINTTGNVNKIVIKFPYELASLDSKLDTTLNVIPVATGTYTYEFTVPLYTEMKPYDLTVTAYNGGSSAVCYPGFVVNDSILNRLKTRTRN